MGGRGKSTGNQRWVPFPSTIAAKTPANFQTAPRMVGSKWGRYLDAASKYIDKSEMANVHVRLFDRFTGWRRPDLLGSFLEKTAITPNVIFINRKTLRNEHPLFVASILFHESVHARNAGRNIGSVKNELIARKKTRDWARHKFFKANPAEKDILLKIYDLNNKDIAMTDFRYTGQKWIRGKHIW